MNSNNVHEVFRYIVNRNIREADFLSDYLNYFYRLVPLMRLASSVSPLLRISQNFKNKRFAFYTTRFNQLFSGLDSRSLLLFGKPQEFAHAVRSRVVFYPVYDIIPELLALYRSDPMLVSAKAAALVDSFTAKLAQMSPEYLVVWNDSLFIERFLIYCGRRAGIKSICIQHGIFHESFDCTMLDGYYSDFMFVWGQSQAELYQDSGFDRNKLRIMGYPYNFDHIGSKHEDVICILGENPEILDRNVGLKKKYVYEQLAALLKSQSYRVVYKPHPFERDVNYIPANMEIVSLPLLTAFRNYGKFIALTSTALLEATLHGKIAIQYYDECFGGCDFSLRGFSYTARSMDEIPLLLSRCTGPSTIDKDALVLGRSPAQLFLKAVDSLPQ